jgi:hypothetical protein
MKYKIRFRIIKAYCHFSMTVAIASFNVRIWEAIDLRVRWDAAENSDESKIKVIFGKSGSLGDILKCNFHTVKTPSFMCCFPHEATISYS